MIPPQVREYLADQIRRNGHVSLPSAMVPKTAPDFPYGTMEGNPGYQMGGSAYGAMDGHTPLRALGNFATRLGHDPMSSLLAGAGMGAAAGAGIGALRQDNPGGKALVGAGVGGTAALALSKLMEIRDQQTARQDSADHAGAIKYSFYAMPGGPNPTQFIQTKLFADMSMAPADKSMLSGMLPNLNMAQAHQLADQLRGAMGAGIGYMVAKYFFKMGLGGRAILALIGGAAGMMTGGGPRNVFGQRTNPVADVFGRARFV